ncbi:MAG TPA: hypothetical protein PLT63_11030 [Syntrophales bacterium]|nr:hypothetical protein [Syntrophales bacterium]
MPDREVVREDSLGFQPQVGRADPQSVPTLKGWGEIATSIHPQVSP